MNDVQSECRRCGTCCISGGPALHGVDLPLIQSGRLPIDRLITIRRGELVDHPLTGKVQTVDYELVKITGTSGEWRCAFYTDDSGCAMYALRPLACRRLKCWEPAGISELVGKDTLTRLDILAEGDPLRSLVEEHERLCPCPDMDLVRRSVVDGSLTDLSDLQNLLVADLNFRSRVVRQQRMSLAEELFAFGRPIFQLLQAVGLNITEVNGGLRLSIP